MIPGYALVVFLDCYILNHIFKPYVKEQEPDEDPDAWSVDESEYVLAESSYTPVFGRDDETKNAQTAAAADTEDTLTEEDAAEKENSNE